MKEEQPQQSILARLEAQGQTVRRVMLRDLLGAPAGGPAVLRTSGRYQILGEIAQGVVGVILRARDGDLGRDVALKVLHARHLENPRMVERLITEAQIGGQLQHPGIVPVYELGLDDQQVPYFAMKLVKGETLAARLQERRDPTQDRRRLVACFEQVCQTMAYAHARGVIHRDLKPSNILLGAYGEVLVVDWGFAKVLSRGGVADEKRATLYRDDITRIETVRTTGDMESLTAAVLGSPAYMPPEQALGQLEDLDKRSDVFSLGAILCEILTGTPPYGTDPHVVLRRAAKGDLSGAIERLEACSVDEALIGLCKSCLAPLRRDRPQDAAVLASTLSRHLAQIEEGARKLELEVIERRRRVAKAKAASAAQQAAAEAARTEARESQAETERARQEAKQAREAANEARRARRQTFAIAAVLLAGTLLGGVAYAWHGGVRDARAREARARIDDGVTTAQRMLADGRTGEAVVAARQAVELATSGDVDEATRARARDVLTSAEAARKAADDAAKLTRKHNALLAALTSCRARHGDAFDARQTDERYRAAFAACGIDENDIDGAGALARTCPDPAMVVAALDDWAWLRCVRLHQPKQAWSPLVRIAERADSDPWRRGVRNALVFDSARELLGLTGTDPAALAPDSARLLGMALAMAGERDSSRVFLQRAEFHHRNDLWLLLLLAAQDETRSHAAPEIPLRHLAAAMSLAPTVTELRVELASAELAAGNPQDALGHCRTALQSAPDMPEAHVLHARILQETGDLEGAVQSWRRAIELDAGSAEARTGLGAALLRMGDLAGARTACAEAARLNPEDGDVQLSLGIASLAAGELSEARAACMAALRADPARAEAHHVLGLVFLKARRVAEARTSLDEALRLAPGDPFVSNSRGLLLLDAGDARGAQTCFEKAATQEGHPRAAALANLAALWLARDDLRVAASISREAVEAAGTRGASTWHEGLTSSGKAPLDQAIEVLRGIVKQNSAYAFAHHRLAIALEKKGHYMDAIQACKKALSLEPDYGYCLQTLAWIYMTSPLPNYRNEREALRLAEALARVPGHPEIEAAQTLGLARYRTGDIDGAIEQMEYCVRTAGGGTAWDWYVLAMARWKRGDEKTARRWLAKAEAWTDANAPRDERLLRFRDEAAALIPAQ